MTSVLTITSGKCPDFSKHKRRILMTIYFTMATFIRLENYPQRVFNFSTFVNVEDKIATLTSKRLHLGFWVTSVDPATGQTRDR